MNYKLISKGLRVKFYTLNRIIPRTMKITICFLLISLSAVFAENSYAQKTIISVEMNNKQIENILETVESQTDFTFLYDASLVNVKRRTSIKVTNRSIFDLLNQLFDNTDIVYSVIGTKIILNQKAIVEAIAQQTGKKIMGTVKDSHGETIIGANVVEKGTTNGTITDLDGKFTLYVNEGSTLIISFIGYTEQEIAIKRKTSFSIIMTEDVKLLDEVVVVGYGSFKKRDLTGSVSQVKGDDIATLPLRSASDALQGKAAGVTITATSGSPGSMGTVRIRGVGTINNNNPLYVVDGLPQDDIGWLNPRDIESIEVLKDASAQAIYGARAANGVILVTSKRGTTEDAYKSTIEFDMSIGFQNIPKRYDMLDAEGFMDYKNRAYSAAGKNLIDDFSTTEKREQILSFLEKNGGRQGTNWWDETTQSGLDVPVQNYNIAFSGGMKNLRYRTSFGYMSQEGIVKGSDYDRLSGRLNLDSKVTEWLMLTTNINVIYESKKNVDENNPWTGTVFSSLTADPITPVYRDNLKDIPDFLQARIMSGYKPTNPWSRYTGVIYSNKPNTVAQVKRMAESKWSSIATKSNISGDIKLFPFLSFKSSFAIDLSRGLSSGFTPKYFLDGDEYNTYATVSKGVGNTDYWVFDNYFTYKQKINKHAIDAMIGTSAEKKHYEYIGASKQGMVNNDSSQQIINAGTLNPGASGYIVNSSLNSYFGRVFYSYADKYLLTANIRWDGSSAFAKGNKWGCFPSVSTGWNFAEENFMGKYEWLSQGKLRAAFGKIGNQNLENTTGAYLDTFSNTGYYLFGNQYTPALGGGRSQVGNSDLKWETTEQLDFGLDLAFFDGSLKANFDYFDRQTHDMLVQVPLPTSIGSPNNPWMNAGSVSNKGIEITLAYDGKINKDLTYHINGNLSTYRNKVKSLGSGFNIPGKQAHLGYYTYTMIEPDMPIGYFYGLKTDGVFQNQAEIDNYINNGVQVMPAAKPGDLKFVDKNKDGKLSDEDRGMIGNPHPDFSFGLL